jgi:pimeloyl-ACP methyl ester carboxylesterase
MMPYADLDQKFSHHKMTINGVTLHYVIGGEGFPLLLWHGFLETWYCWRKVMPALAEKYTVIAPDMRGYGDSEKPESGYDAWTLAEDFRQLIAQLGFEQIYIAAHDMGAPPALIYAGEHPEEVRGLVYLDEPVLLADFMQQVLKFSPDTMQDGGLWWWVFSLVADLPEKLIAGKEREFLTYFYDKYLFDRASITPDVIEEYLRSFAAPGGVSGALGVYRSIFESIAQTEKYVRDKLKAPVLALGGERSMGTHTFEMMKRVAINVQGGSVDRCGHFIPDEQPDYLIKALLKFFQSL